MGVHVLLAILAFLSISAVILSTVNRQRVARLERRVTHLENETGVDEEEHYDTKTRPHADTLRGRTHGLEIRTGVLERRVARKR